MIPVSVPIHEDEDIRGYVARLADRNGMSINDM